MSIPLSFIGGWLTEKFFVGRKIEQLKEDHSSKIEELEKNQNAIGELLRIIEIAEKAKRKGVRGLSNFELLEYRALTATYENCFPDPDDLPRTIDKARAFILFIRKDGYEKAEEQMKEL